MARALILRIWVCRGFVSGTAAFAGTGVSFAEDGGAGFAAVACLLLLAALLLLISWVLREGAGVI